STPRRLTSTTPPLCANRWPSTPPSSAARAQDSPHPLKCSHGPHFPFLPLLEPKARRQAATAIFAFEPNSCKPLPHSLIPLATSSYSHPRTHFAPPPSFCDAPSSPPRSPHRRGRAPMTP